MFEGQVVAITGASGGIGRGFAQMFIENGAKVAISDRASPVETAQEIGATAYACDVTDEAQMQAFVKGVNADLGPIDIFISNAGVGYGDGPEGLVGGGSDKSWDLSWKINVMASVFAARAVMPDWVERGSGRFVVTASAAGLLNLVGSASYSVTKHAAVGFAEAVAITHKDDGIKVNCVCPQFVRSNMTKGQSFAEGNKDGLLEPSDVADALKQAIIDDEFLVLSHKVVGDYVKGKAMDYDGYITGMAKMKAKLGPMMMDN